MEICESVMCQYYGEDWESHLPPCGKFDETCQGCVPLAFHIVKESRSFEDAIRKAILYGGDSDTLGAIVGSLAEAYFVVDPAMIQTAMGYCRKICRTSFGNLMQSTDERIRFTAILPLL